MKKRILFLLVLTLILPLASAVEIGEIFTIQKDKPIIEKEDKTTTYFYAGSKLIASKNNNEIKYQYQDRLNSDINTKALPFGQEINSDERFSFTGKELDNSGLYYFNARYYDSNIGRFTSIDPVKENHAYSYVANNPMNYVDPSGMDGSSFALSLIGSYPLEYIKENLNQNEIVGLSESSVGLGLSGKISRGIFSFGGSMFNTQNAMEVGNRLGLDPKLGAGFGGKESYSEGFGWNGLTADISGSVSLRDSSWSISARGFNLFAGAQKEYGLFGGDNNFFQLSGRLFGNLIYNSFKSRATAKGQVAGEGSIDLSYRGIPLYSHEIENSIHYTAGYTTNTKRLTGEGAFGIVARAGPLSIGGGPLMQYSFGGIERDVSLFGQSLTGDNLRLGNTISQSNVGLWGDIGLKIKSFEAFANLKNGIDDQLNIGIRGSF